LDEKSARYFAAVDKKPSRRMEVPSTPSAPKLPQKPRPPWTEVYLEEDDGSDLKKT
jgi:hypothetical protein